MAGNPNIDHLIASTIDKYLPVMVSTILDQQIIFNMMMKFGGVETKAGGLSIREPLLYGENSTVRSFKDYDLFDTTPSYPLTGNQQEWKQIVGTISQSGFEDFVNNSAEQKISLMSARIKQLEETFIIYMCEKMFGDGSGNGSKDFLGLTGMLDYTGANSTYGGINSGATGNEWWKNKQTTGVGTFSTTSGSSTVGRKAMTSMFHSLTIGAQRPDLLITTQVLLEEYEYSLDQNYRTMDLQIGKRGYRALEFMGAPVVWDISCQTGLMWFLNLMQMKLYFGKNKTFELGEWVKMHNQDAKYASVIVYLATICLNRKYQGVLAGMTP